MSAVAAYLPLLRTPGAARFMAGSMFSRVGGSMFGIAVLVMVSERRGSYAEAGLINGVALIVLAISSPVLGGLIDRYGQARVALPFAVWTAMCSYATALLSWRSGPLWALVLTYAASAVVPASGPMSRARWAWIYRDEPERLHTAMSLEQVADEASFVVSPVIAVLASTLWFPEAGLVLAATLYSFGLIIFVSSRATEPALVPQRERPEGVAIRRPGVAVIAGVLVMTGMIFGSNEVAAVAFAQESGSTAWSSVILAAFAVGSMLSAVVFGTRTMQTTLTQRLVWAASAMFVLELPALLVPNPVTLALVMLVAGAATAPTIITGFSLTERLVPRGLVTEALSVTTTALIIGLSAGAFAGGLAVERWGARPAYAVPVTAGALAVLILLVNRRRLQRAEKEQA